MQKKTFALHLPSEINVRKRASSSGPVRFATVKAKDKKEATEKLLGIYSKHQTTGSFPKGYSIDELK